MKLFIFGLILQILIFTALWIFVTPFAALGFLLALILYVTYSLYKEKKASNKILEEKVQGRIWDIPIIVDCGDRSCNKSHQINFSLNTTHYQCSNCGKINKLSVSFTSIPQ